MIRPAVLIVMDGLGLAADGPGNAVSLANTSYLKYLYSNFPHGQLHASGEAVGLPRGERGNTETGHLNLGAGRIIYQDLPRINMAIADGSFYSNSAFLQAISHCEEFNSNLHVMGLVGGGGVHANNEHLFALLYLLKEHRFNRVFIHVFTDGRDSPPTVALEYVKKIKDHLKLLELGEIASVSGRYYAMDRDQRWDRTKKAYDMLTIGTNGPDMEIEEIIKKSYEKGVTDEFIIPTSVRRNGKTIATIKKSDSVIFYNFRIDRPRQLTKAFVLDDFGHAKSEKFNFNLFRHDSSASNSIGFDRGEKIANLFFVTMTEYAKNLPVVIAFPPQIVNNPFGRVISERGMRQLRLTESEKERFVTFYFNGQRESPFIGEDRLIIPSLKVPTYDMAPAMRSAEITHTLLNKLKEKTYDFILINFPNPDMVGHSGNISAAVKAIEAVDESLEKVVPAILEAGGGALITADHGNCEEMIDPKTGGVDTEHSTYPVPLIVATPDFEGKAMELPTGILGDVAPTLLKLMEIEKPVEMTGRNLLT